MDSVVHDICMKKVTPSRASKISPKIKARVSEPVTNSATSTMPDFSSEVSLDDVRRLVGTCAILC